LVITLLLQGYFALLLLHLFLETVQIDLELLLDAYMFADLRLRLLDCCFQDLVVFANQIAELLVAYIEKTCCIWSMWLSME
jgi:hypothetical protein